MVPLARFLSEAWRCFGSFNESSLSEGWNEGITENSGSQFLDGLEAPPLALGIAHRVGI